MNEEAQGFQELALNFHDCRLLTVNYLPGHTGQNPGPRPGSAYCPNLSQSHGGPVVHNMKARKYKEHSPSMDKYALIMGQTEQPE